MFGLSDFAGAPFSAYLQFSPKTTVSGLQANALLDSVSTGSNYGVTLTGVSATATLNSGAAGKTFPVAWTLIDTTQYPIS
jgi:hypothetical protein